MKRFRDYLREDKGLDVDAIFPDHEKPLGTERDSQDADALLKIARMAVESHYDEMLLFFQELGRKDMHIQDELDAINRNNANSMRPKRKGGMPPGHNGEHDNEVVPAGADRADGGGTEPAGGD